jgi:anti-sigma factor RsiW
LDGELPPGETKAVADLLEGDAEARTIFQELTATKSLLSQNELDLPLPETREFYWSKIRRDIEREQQTQTARWKSNVLVGRMRFFVPAGALAALAVLVAIAVRNQDGGQTLLASHEIETPLEETSSFSFRSEAAAMTVVWVDSHRE